ncbi:BnaA06g20360D [Brassica napus]|uniref:BnaA06g20360D protein n=1 Tax=Brassica napus TaxID=3708 RepID=A0A078H2A4_BRANA|nr:BnaA06g20360D [Brassica napus]
MFVFFFIHLQENKVVKAKLSRVSAVVVYLLR